MTVCDSCKGYGEIIKRVPSAKELETRAKGKEKEREEFGKNRLSAPKGEVLLLVRPDYAKVIKGAREQLGLNQEDLAKRLRIRESQLHKYETGSHAPDIETARIFEKELKIRLILEYNEEVPRTGSHRTGDPLTIADFMKKR